MDGYLILFETKVKCLKIAQCPNNVLLHVDDMIETEDKDQGKVLSVVRIYKTDDEYLDFIQKATRQETHIPKVTAFWRMIEVEYDAAE